MGQYPIQKTNSFHVVLNQLEDGSSISYLDITSGLVRWDMRLSGINKAEVQAIQSLFNSSYGPWSGFVFLDPVDNLLSASANLQDSSWQAATGIDVIPGVSDPQGGTTACSLSNGSQEVSTFSQTLSSPANYVYTLSVYLRASAPAQVVLFGQTGSEVSSTTVQITNAWTRAVAEVRLTNPADIWSAGLQLAPGQQIQAFGPQVDAQPTASPYRQTTGRGGIYPDTHWAMDALAIAVTGPNQFSAQISLESYRAS